LLSINGKHPFDSFLLCLYATQIIENAFDLGMEIIMIIWHIASIHVSLDIYVYPWLPDIFPVGNISVLYCSSENQDYAKPWIYFLNIVERFPK